MVVILSDEMLLTGIIRFTWGIKLTSKFEHLKKHEENLEIVEEIIHKEKKPFKFTELTDASPQISNKV